MSNTTRTRAKAPRQQGVALLEALVAIIIFSIGIIGLIALQATSMRTVGDSKMRVDAAQLAQKLVAEMWAMPRDGNGQVVNAYLTANYASPNGPGYVRWYENEVRDFNGTNGSRNGLPGARANAPTVAVGADNSVVITVFWRAPTDPSVRQYVTRTVLF